MKIGILSRNKNLYSTRRLAEAASERGHKVDVIDFVRSKKGPVIMEVNSSPGLEGIESATGKDVAGTIIDFIASNAAMANTKTKGKG